MAGLTMNVDRASAVDFTYPFWFEPSAALMKVITDCMCILCGKSKSTNRISMYLFTLYYHFVR